MAKEKNFFKYKYLFYIVSLLIVLISIYAYNSPLFKFNFNRPLKAEYIELPDLIPLEGKLAPNNKLEEAKYLGHKQAVGPENFEVNTDGSIYTGLLNGQVVKLNPDGSFTKITQIGSETNETICSDYGINLHSHLECGRPLGLRFKKNTSELYIADAYYGIVKVDVVTGFKTYVFKSHDKRLGNLPLKLTNDLDLDGNVIYFIDSSYERNINEAIEEHIEATPRGRLFSYNEKTDELELLAQNLYFPNGLQLTPEKDVLLINENSKSRIIKFYLNGEKKGQIELFVNLPGYGDTIRLTDHRTLLVPFASVRVSKVRSILDLLGKHPSIRNFFGLFLNLRYFFTMLPKYGLIAEYDLNGNILKSWSDPSGKIVECVTSGLILDNKLYLGSFYNDFIAVINYN